MKVKCISDYENNFGGCEPIKGNLEVGDVYEVERVEEHSWHTKYFINGKDYNSVHFEVITKYPTAIK